MLKTITKLETMARLQAMWKTDIIIYRAKKATKDLSI